MTTREDRIKGVLVGMATGDALGVPYELGKRVPDSGPVMEGGGYGFAPGEWSDGRSDPDLVAGELLAWYRSGPADVGPTTGATLARVPRNTPVTAAHMAFEAAKARRGRAEGQISNGSLMRTGPACLPFLGDRKRIAEAARAISNLTHYDPYAGDACVLWSLAIDLAVTDDSRGWSVQSLVRHGCQHIPHERQDFWREVIAESLSLARHPSRRGQADPAPPRSLTSNLNVVKAFGAALYAVELAQRPGSPWGPGLPAGLVHAVRIGGDTDTVAAIAGALLGAIYGASAVPADWRKQLHGWPGDIKADDLETLAVQAAYGSSGQHGELGTDDPEEYLP